MHATFLPAKRTGAQGMACYVRIWRTGKLVTSLFSDLVGLLLVTSTKIKMHMHGSGCPLFVLALLPAFPPSFNR